MRLDQLEKHFCIDGLDNMVVDARQDRFNVVLYLPVPRYRYQKDSL